MFTEAMASILLKGFKFTQSDSTEHLSPRRIVSDRDRPSLFVID
jgi:hypothetical protein